MGYQKQHVPIRTAADAYELVAAQYDKDQAYYDEVDLKAFTKALPGALTGLQILDAGGGTGRWAARFARRGAVVTLLDPAPSMLRLAKQKVHGVKTVEGVVQDLPFPDASFDVVACAFVLGYVDDLPAALAELVRVLKPGGLLLVSQSPERKSPKHVVEGKSDFLIEVTFHRLDAFVGALEEVHCTDITTEEVLAKKGAALGWVITARKGTR